DAAARYLVDFARRHGLSGPNPNDPQGPYTQTFKLYRFSAAAPAHEHEAPSDKTEELYQHGFSVGTAPLSPEDVDLIAERWAAADPAAAARFRALASRPGLEGDALR